MNISIIGTGYIGLVTGTCLADFGLSVTCVDQDETKISLLNFGGVPIYELNFAPLIEKNISAGRLTFTTDLEKAVKESKVIFIAVGTPSNDDGSANLVQIEEVAKQIALFINNYKVIVIKSTVPVGTTRKINEIINKYQTLSLRATEGSAAIPSSVILAKAGTHPSSPSPLRGEGRVRVKYSSVIARSEATEAIPISTVGQASRLSILFPLTSSPTQNSFVKAQQSMTLPTLTKLDTSTPWQWKIPEEFYLI